MAVYLLVLSPAPTSDERAALSRMYEETHWASDDCMLIASDEHLSAVYHAVKWQLRDDSSLLAVEVEGAKCRYQSSGTTTWLRARLEADEPA